MMPITLICILFTLYKCSYASELPVEPKIGGMSVEIDGRCYYFPRFESVNRAEAMSNCETVNMTLVSFETKVENDAVMTKISEMTDLDFWMWTSATRAADTTDYFWNPPSGPVPVSYTEWITDPSEPTTAAVCVNFSYTAGGWDDDLCNRKMSYLCEEMDEVSVGCDIDYDMNF